MYELDLSYIQGKAEEIAERQSRQADFALAGDRFDFAKKGFYAIRVLGPYSQKGRIHREVYKHWQLPGKKGPVACLKTWPDLKMSCPICDALEKMRDGGIEFDSRMYAQMNPYVNCIPRKVEGREVVGEWFIPEEPEGDGFKVWVTALPWTVHNWFITQLALMAPKGKNPASPACGMDLVFTKVVKKNDKGKETTRYENPGFLYVEGPAVTDPEKLKFVTENLKDLDEAFPPPDEVGLQSVKNSGIALLVAFGLLSPSAAALQAPSRPAPPVPSADLPPGWKRHATNEGKEYYEGPDGSTTWDKPKPKMAPPPPAAPPAPPKPPAPPVAPPPVEAGPPPVSEEAAAKKGRRPRSDS